MPPTAPPALSLHADGVCLSLSDGEFGGYGVHAADPPVRISEPLPGTIQTEDLAQLHALLCALELAHGLRVRVAVIHVASQQLAHAYPHLPAWRAADWRADGRSVRHRSVWREVLRLQDALCDRGVRLSVVVKPRHDSHSMRAAARLAREGAHLHETCALCGKTHGRQWANHGCEPICNRDSCSGRVLRDVPAYAKHVERRHSRSFCRRADCSASFSASASHERDAHERDVHSGKVYPCPHCHKHYRSESKVARHIESPCPKAPYCADCNRYFVAVDELQRHVAAVHAESPSEDWTSDSDSEPVIEHVSSQYDHAHRQEECIHAAEKGRDWRDRECVEEELVCGPNDVDSDDSELSASHPLFRGDLAKDDGGREWCRSHAMHERQDEWVEYRNR